VIRESTSGDGAAPAMFLDGAILVAITAPGAPPERVATRWSSSRPSGMVDGMATKKYTVTLPEELAEEIRSQVGPGGFSRYVTQAVERQRERERLHEAVDWWEAEYGPVTEEELAEAEAERKEIERAHAEREERARKAAQSSGEAA
jgi:Arc/MetJ-type ribon-helix-helix transcriptional regulator